MLSMKKLVLVAGDEQTVLYQCFLKFSIADATENGVSASRP